MTRALLVWMISAAACLSALPGQAEESEPISFEERDGSLQIIIGKQPITEYVWKDEQTSRPYFRHMRTRSGVQVSRNHPPVKGEDLDDHPTMHPGLWLAFGDLGGADFWRNKAQVRHVEFSHKAVGNEGTGSFTVQNAYENNGQVICTETCRITVTTRPEGYILRWESTFRSNDGSFAFGDQEEMGLGLRVATPLAVVKGGQILDSEGRKNGEHVWGKQADWCEYSGVLDGQKVGVVLMPDPQNFRKCWFHARDYGLLVANPFGLNAFTKGETSKVIALRGKDFRLGFNVLVYNTQADQTVDVASVYTSVSPKPAPKP